MPTDHRRTGPRRGARCGFTLIEITVAIMLLALTATGLVTYTAYVGQARLVSKQRALGLVAAQEAIDYVRSKPFDSITPGTEEVESTVGGIPVRVTTSIELTRPNMKLIGVTVTSTEGRTLQEFLTAVFKPRL